eukprot:191880_1
MDRSNQQTSKSGFETLFDIIQKSISEKGYVDFQQSIEIANNQPNNNTKIFAQCFNYPGMNSNINFTPVFMPNTTRPSKHFVINDDGEVTETKYYPYTKSKRIIKDTRTKICAVKQHKIPELIPDYITPNISDCIQNDYGESQKFIECIMTAIKSNCTPNTISECLQLYTYMATYADINTDMMSRRQSISYKEDYISNEAFSEYHSYCNKDKGSNILIDGICKLCIQRLFIETNGGRLMFNNIKHNVNGYLNKNIVSSDNHKSYLLMCQNWFLFYLLLQYPQLALIENCSEDIVFYVLKSVKWTGLYLKYIRQNENINKKINYNIIANHENVYLKNADHILHYGVEIVSKLIGLLKNYLKLFSLTDIKIGLWFKNIFILQNELNLCPFVQRDNVLWFIAADQLDHITRTLKSLLFMNQHNSFITDAENEKRKQKIEQKMKKNVKRMKNRKKCMSKNCKNIKGTQVHRKWFVCKGCKITNYCSRYCQKCDWNHGLHKQFCHTVRKTLTYNFFQQRNLVNGSVS